MHKKKKRKRPTTHFSNRPGPAANSQPATSQQQANSPQQLRSQRPASQQPVSSQYAASNQPAAASQQPVSNPANLEASQPATSKQQPAASNQQAATSSRQPASSQQPVAKSQQPTRQPTNRQSVRCKTRTPNPADRTSHDETADRSHSTCELQKHVDYLLDIQGQWSLDSCRSFVIPMNFHEHQLASLVVK